MLVMFYDMIKKRRAIQGYTGLYRAIHYYMMQHSTLLRKSTVQSNVSLNSLNPIIRLRLRLRLRPQTHLASLMTRFQSTSSPSHVASSPALNLLSVSRVKPPHVNWTYGEFLTMPEWMGFTSMTCC